MFMNAARTLRVHCVEGITANVDIMRHYVDYSIGTVTALNPVIGYDKSTELAAEAMKTGRGILELIREKKILTEKQIAEVLDPAAMTARDARREPREDPGGRVPRARPGGPSGDGGGSGDAARRRVARVRRQAGPSRASGTPPRRGRGHRGPFSRLRARSPSRRPRA